MSFFPIRRGIAIAVVALISVTMFPSGVIAHDPTGEQADALKGRLFDGHLDPISPGGVPLEPISNAPCIDGLAADLFPCDNVDLMSFVPLPGLEATFVNDVWGWTDPLSKQQIAIAGTFEGTAFVDVTDGYNPIYLGTLPSAVPGDFGNIWGDIRVYGNTAYIGSEAVAPDLSGFGVQIVDLTQFSGATGPIEVAQAGHIDDITNSHNLSLNTDSGRLYIVGSVVGLQECQVGDPQAFVNGNGGALVYDVASDPHNPTFIGCLTQDGYSHDIQCVDYRGPDRNYRGAEICIGSNEDTLTVYDATNLTNPQVIAKVEYQPFPFIDEEGQPPSYYTHQGWLSEKHDLFFLDDEFDEFLGGQTRTTFIFDFSNLDDIQLINGFTEGATSIDHNLFVDKQRLYQSNYTDGLWIYDEWLAENGVLDLRGTFDVYPANDDTIFAGSWGNYPYFGKGKVIVTSSDEGLFVVDAKDAQNRAGGHGKN
jgi:choice-of-anchor B domain-containing protein